MTVWKSPLSRRPKQPRPTLFLDRDGVVIADEDYLADPEQVRLLPGVPDALQRAQRAGFLLVGVSNQSGIGRGYFGQEDFHRVMLRLEADLAAVGVHFDSFHYCPHAPGEDCSCRKPRRGMFDEACLGLAIDPARSWMVGDKESDVAFGRGVGLGAVLVRTGYGAREEAGVRRHWSADPRVLVAEDLPAALDLILEHHRKEG